MICNFFEFRFNAYAIHGVGDYGEAAPKDVYYQALYPVDPVKRPNADFHYLEAFEPIDLSAIGFVQDAEKSELWKTATGDEDYTRL